MINDERQNRMYSNVPNLIIGFHGCDSSIATAVVNGKMNLKNSSNAYDWLGNGMYFWEQNLSRAWQWAVDSANNPKSSITEPAVIGAVIDLGYCLNLMDSRSVDLLKRHYGIFCIEQDQLKGTIPKNKNIKGNSDLLLRELDCGVIESLHAFRKLAHQREFDSVRGLFLEGGEIYPTSGFREKTHIQIAVRNPNCIKGFFLPRDVDKNWSIP